MRSGRYKSQDEAFYHLFTRVAGSPRYYPLHRPEAWQKLLELIRFYIRVYCCELVAYQILGNHYHLIAYIEKFCELSREELERRARLLYGKRAALVTGAWSDSAWEKFNRKLFDLSALMQHINGEFAKWFNQTYGRRGHFWADRFKNVELLDFEALQECLFYVELNALRAGLVKRPEDWKAGSARDRHLGTDEGLMPLARIFPEMDTAQLFSFYRSQLYHRGGLELEEGELPSLPGSDENRPELRGLYRRRHRFFTDGLAVACDSGRIVQLLIFLRKRGRFKRRKNAKVQLDGLLYTVREQRSNTRS